MKSLIKKILYLHTKIEYSHTVNSESYNIYFIEKKKQFFGNYFAIS